MLETVCASLKNWFLIPGAINIDTYTIEGGSLELPFLREGQYFRIIGSVFNDGIHQYPASELKDERFHGAVWALAIPEDFLALVNEIEEWQKKNGEASTSPYQSESFGGYSYTRANSSSGGAMTWETAFRSRLNRWRKI